jgi:hypothetical protein
MVSERKWRLARSQRWEGIVFVGVIGSFSS